MLRSLVVARTVLLVAAVAALVAAAEPAQDAIYRGDVVVVIAAGAKVTAAGAAPRELAVGTRLTVTEVRGDYLGVVGEVNGAAVRGWLRRESAQLELAPPPAAATPVPLAPDDAAALASLRERGALLELGPAGTVVAVDARASDLDADSLARLAGLPGLVRLDLGGRPVGGGLAALARLSGLRELYLDHCPVGDDDLAAVSRLTSLEILSLAGSRVSGRGLPHLSSLRHLTSLNLRRCAVTDRDLAALAPLTALEVLVLAETEVRGSGLPTLAPLTNLIVLNLNRCPLDPSALRALDGMDSIKMLFLRGCAVPTEVADHLRATIPSLCVDTRPFSPEEDERDGISPGGQP